MTVTPIKDEEQLGQICRGCGFCCSGVLFDHGWLDDDELEFARSIGLSIATDTNTQSKRFHQPCPHLCGTSCSIYEQGRPRVCSKFFCELAKKFNHGEISAAALKANISEARTLMARIEPMFLPGETWPAARARWFSNRNERPRNPEEAEFRLLMTALNLFLDRNFRTAGQRIMSIED